jgi:hypothetical protein
MKKRVSPSGKLPAGAQVLGSVGKAMMKLPRGLRKALRSGSSCGLPKQNSNRAKESTRQP